MFLPEAGRWAGTAAFPAAVLSASAFILAGVLANQTAYLFFWEGDRAAHSVLYWTMMAGGSSFLPAVAYCLYSLPAAGMYAEDYRSGAAYMRIQRMGCTRYALGRVIHTAASAGLCACLAEAAAVLALTAGFGVPLLLGEDVAQLQQSFGWSTLLRQGSGYGFFLTVFLRRIMGAVFYALAAAAFSAFVADRQVVLALPLLYWYFNQYVLVSMEWVPEWLQPRLLYETDYRGGISSLSDWQWAWTAAGATLAAAAAVFLLLRLRLAKNGIFGGGDG